MSQTQLAPRGMRRSHVNCFLRFTLPCFCLFSCSCLQLYSQFQPYDDDSDDAFQELAQWQIFVTLFG